MLDMVFQETREQIAQQEDWVNTTLHADYPGVTVCLHADKTMTVTYPDLDHMVTTVECDYCPAAAFTVNTTPPQLPAWYFSENPGRIIQG